MCAQLWAPSANAALVLTAAAGGAGAVLAVRGRAAPALALLLAATLIASSGWAGARLAAGSAPALAVPAEVSGVVAVDRIPVRSDRGGWRMRAASERLAGEAGRPVPAGTRLLVDLAPGPGGPPRVGDLIAVSGTVREPAGGDAPRWWRRYLTREGIRGRIAVERAEVVGRRGGLAGARDAWRDWAVRSAAAGLEGDRAALVRGMLLGATDGLSASTEEAFRDAGLWHLLAVSGQNVTVVALAALMALRVLRFGRRTASLAALALVVAYCLACDPGPSVARAGVMGGVAILGDLRSSPAGRWHLLAVALAALLAHRPRAIGDPGLQLSFAAVAGLFLLAGPLAARLARTLPPRLAELAALAAAAGVATAPVVVWHFGRLSLVGLPLNVVAVPLAAPIVVLALCALGASAVSGPLAVALAWPAGVGAAAMIRLADMAASVPGAAVDLPRWAAAAAVPGAVGAWVVAGRASAPGARRRAWPAPPVAAVAAVVLVLVAVAHWPGPAAPWPDRPAVTVLDVGQGEALLLRSPGGEAALVDAGPPGGPAQAAAALDRHGVGMLAFVAITHPARDHDGGLADVLATPGARAVLLPDPASPGWSAVRGVAARAGVPVAGVREGDVLRLGEWRLRVVHPRPGAVARVGDANEASLVVEATARGASVLLTGDAESPQLTAVPGPVDVLKVGHHGSSDEGLTRLLGRLRPRTALISVGAENRHGHPHPATLAALAAARARVLRTDRDGDLTIAVGADPAGGCEAPRCP